MNHLVQKLLWATVVLSIVSCTPENDPGSVSDSARDSRQPTVPTAPDQAPNTSETPNSKPQAVSPEDTTKPSVPTDPTNTGTEHDHPTPDAMPPNPTPPNPAPQEPANAMGLASTARPTSSTFTCPSLPEATVSYRGGNAFFHETTFQPDANQWPQFWVTVASVIPDAGGGPRARLFTHSVRECTAAEQASSPFASEGACFRLILTGGLFGDNSWQDAAGDTLPTDELSTRAVPTIGGISESMAIGEFLNMPVNDNEHKTWAQLARQINLQRIYDSAMTQQAVADSSNRTCVYLRTATTSTIGEFRGN